MAKMGAIAVICVLALLSVARASENFSVTGKVYCDNCDAGFPTRISPAIAGATVAVECKDTNGKQTFYATGLSGKDGKFSIAVVGERPRELCKAQALSSPDDKCSIPTDVNEGPVYLTHNNGINSDERMTGPFCFKSAEKHPQCGAVMAEFNIY